MLVFIDSSPLSSSKLLPEMEEERKLLETSPIFGRDFPMRGELLAGLMCGKGLTEEGILGKSYC